MNHKNLKDYFCIFINKFENPHVKQIFLIYTTLTVNQSTKTIKRCKQKFYAFEDLFVIVSLIIQIMSLSLVADYESSSSESESESAEIRFDFTFQNIYVCFIVFDPNNSTYSIHICFILL